MVNKVTWPPIPIHVLIIFHISLATRKRKEPISDIIWTLFYIINMASLLLFPLFDVDVDKSIECHPKKKWVRRLETYSYGFL